MRAATAALVKAAACEVNKAVSPFEQPEVPFELPRLRRGSVPRDGIDGRGPRDRSCPTEPQPCEGEGSSPPHPPGSGRSIATAERWPQATAAAGQGQTLRDPASFKS